jgi:hypothetical protein
MLHTRICKRNQIFSEYFCKDGSNFLQTLSGLIPLTLAVFGRFSKAENEGGTLILRTQIEIVVKLRILYFSNSLLCPIHCGFSLFLLHKLIGKKEIRTHDIMSNGVCSL